MARLKVDIPSLIMGLSFTANMIVSLYDPTEIILPREIGEALLVCGFLIFAYVLFYLKSGFFGETEPKLDHLITERPYRFCKHPQYLSFIIMVLGIYLMLRSVIGVVFTLIVLIPSAVYRGKIEDKLLQDKFGEEWRKYADKVGFLLPKLRRHM
jgi:protein-S-isoprenylcysteine O-methyltransferase Ste14